MVAIGVIRFHAADPAVETGVDLDVGVAGVRGRGACIDLQIFDARILDSRCKVGKQRRACIGNEKRRADGERRSGNTGHLHDLALGAASVRGLSAIAVSAIALLAVGRHYRPIVGLIDYSQSDRRCGDAGGAGHRNRSRSRSGSAGNGRGLRSRWIPQPIQQVAVPRLDIGRTAHIEVENGGVRSRAAQHAIAL